MILTSVVVATVINISTILGRPSCGGVDLNTIGTKDFLKGIKIERVLNKNMKPKTKQQKRVIQRTFKNSV